MTQVDFYILADRSTEAQLKVACRLADKAVQQNLDVFLVANNETDARALDDLLWTFAQNSFLPHRFAWDAQCEPVRERIVIGMREHAAAGDTDQDDGRWGLMVNLSAEVPDTFSRYERLAEVITAEPTCREQGRERYRFYRDRGYSLQTHEL